MTLLAWAREFSSEETKPAILRGTTDAQGQFKFEPLRARRILVLSAAPGRAFSSFSPLAVKPTLKLSAQNPYAPVTLRLAPIKPLQLRLVDMQKRPVAGAQIKFSVRRPPLTSLTTVNLSSFNNEHMSLPDETSIGEKALPILQSQVRSNARGQAVLPFGAAGDEITVAISARGLQTVYARLLVSSDNSLTLRLPPGGTVRGRLTRGKNKPPIAGARLTSVYTGAGVVTDAQGRFVLEGLDEGDNSLFLRAPGLVMRPVRVQARRGAIKDIGAIVATPGCVLRGVLKMPKTNEASRFWVLVNDLNHRGTSNVSSSTSVGEDGSYRLRVPPGKYGIRVLGPNQRGQNETVVQATEGGLITTNFDLTRPMPARAATANRATPVRRRATPQPLRLAFDTVIGKVVMKGSDEPVEGAVITLQANGEKLQTTTSNKRGDFVFGRLPDRGPGVPAQYVLSAQAPASSTQPMTASASISPYSDKIVTLHMTTGRPLRVRVANTEGQAVAGATVSLDGVSSATETWPRMAPPAGEESARRVTTQEDGTATLPTLPPNSYVQFKVQHPDYADAVHILALPRTDTPVLKIGRPATIEGRVLLDGRPFGEFPLRVKGQGSNLPWASPEYWRTAPVAADGTYRVTGVPSLEMMGQTAYLVNLDPQGQKPGMTAAYVPPGNGYDLMLTRQSGTRTERWISRVAMGRTGIRYKEGETVQHDIEFKPMALLKGRILIDGKPAARQPVSHPNRDSAYGQWLVRCDKDGRFELPVPTGDVTLSIANSFKQTVKGVQPHSVRQVEWKLTKAKAAARASFVQRRVLRLMMRVLGPDGATVPRPDIKWSIDGRALSQERIWFGQQPGIDGTVEVWDVRIGQQMEVTSPHMNKPTTIKVTEKVLRNQEAVRIRFDRLPTQIAPQRSRPDFGGSRSQRQAVAPPEPAIVGETAPELRVDKWLHGGPLSLAKLRGRVVLLAFNGYGSESDSKLETLASRFKDRGLTIIVVQPSYYSNMFRSRAGETGVDAVAQDIEVQRDWRGFNARRYGCDWGAALVGRDGRFVAKNLQEPFLSAKVEQLLSEELAP